ncbi:MAG: hypothetical protein C0599_15465 [Salinivirgaceae bacterium]|nr:MAG: hypothetical protein C0599_15465 [Salinivirgaceae bacterium]
MKRILLLLLIPTMFFACEALTGKEIGRLEINQVSTEDNMVIKEITLDLMQGDEVGVWSEMDFKYEGDVGIMFRIQVLKDGEELTVVDVDPREKNISINEVRTEVNEKVNWRFVGKNTTISIDESGLYTFKAGLIASDNGSLEVKKAELVFKK